MFKYIGLYTKYITMFLTTVLCFVIWSLNLYMNSKRFTIQCLHTLSVMSGNGWVQCFSQRYKHSSYFLASLWIFSFFSNPVSDVYKRQVAHSTRTINYIYTGFSITGSKLWQTLHYPFAGLSWLMQVTLWYNSQHEQE